MAREKMFDPGFQKAFTEAILKENKIRTTWHARYRKKEDMNFYGWEDVPDDDDDDFCLSPPRQIPDECCDMTSGQPLYSLDCDDPGEIDTLPVMKEVPKATKKKLYKGLSHHGEGRMDYLGTRCRESIPEERYLYPITSAFEYGWTYGMDHPLEYPEFGHQQIIKTSFFRRTDTQLKPRD